MELISLFVVFIKIGFTSFGGMSMVPIINQEMLSHGWMTSEDVANILAIAEMTPGPLGLNCATFAGMQVAGVLGGIIAVLGVLTPAFTTTMLVAAFYQKFKETRFMSSALYVIRPVCIGLMIAVILSLSETTYLDNTALHLSSLTQILELKNIIVGILSLVLLLKYKRNVIQVICISAVAGLLLHLLPV